ncbi:MAG: methyltransferase domain-containing protein [Solirubrobacteraceae bacterium]|jgi:hypothetical protein
MEARTVELPTARASRSSCRSCGSALERVFADLGMTPLANSFLRADQLEAMEPFYPLRALVCDECLLVQLDEYQSPASIFSEYAYFSSYSTAWQQHCRAYTEQIIPRLELDDRSFVVEIASNDGCLLRNFVERGIPARGVEPAANVARVAIDAGLPTVVDFFGRRVARELAAEAQADLIVANNVVPHTPTLSDMVGGMQMLLAREGTITVEFQHLQKLIALGEFDTIYHEHFSYFTLGTFDRVLRAHDLAGYDVEELPTHGGSLRVYAAHAEQNRPASERYQAVLAAEAAAGLHRIDGYADFNDKVRQAKREIVRFFLGLKDEGASIAAYGAPAKGNTLLNYCGLGTDVIDFTVDRNPRKQDTFLPGTHIPVLAPSAIEQARPDVVFILPWNLRDEVMTQLAHIREWGGRFAVRYPEMRLYD